MMVVHHFWQAAARTLVQVGAPAAIGAIWRRATGGASLPPNVVKSDDGTLVPAIGYTWVSDAPGEFAVRWVPGKEEAQLHLVAGASPGKWHPAPGYLWVTPEDTDSIDVRWAPGSPHGKVPHVVAAPDEGKWRAAQGYRFLTDEPGDMRVVSVGTGGRGGAPTPEQIQRIKDLATLGLDQAAGHRAIEDAFRRLVKLHHPDRFVSAGADAVRDAQAAFKLLRQAYERLKAARI